MKNLLHVVAISLSALFLSGCLNSDSNQTSTTAVKVAYFVDSPVVGANYYSLSEEGVTGEDGSFYYKDDENTTFSIGSVVLGTISSSSINADEKVLPHDLVGIPRNTTNKAVVNIAQFLQSLDDDSNATNGIKISEDTKKLITSSENIQNISDDKMADIISSANKPIIHIDNVISHLNNTLLAINPSNEVNFNTTPTVNESVDTGTLTFTIDKPDNKLFNYISTIDASLSNGKTFTITLGTPFSKSGITTGNYTLTFPTIGSPTTGEYYDINTTNITISKDENTTPEITLTEITDLSRIKGTLFTLKGVDQDQDVTLEFNTNDYVMTSSSIKMDSRGLFSCTGQYLYFVKGTDATISFDINSSEYVQLSPISIKAGEETECICVTKKPFYRDDAKNVVIDTVNNLMWNDSSSEESLNFNFSTNTYCNDLTAASYTDWALPTEDQYDKLTASNTYLVMHAAFNNLSSNYYWSSTEINSSYAKAIKLGDFLATRDNTSKEQNLSVRCVRVNK